ncbi:lipoprotein-anchoring transpeptidase ErfK/SrfK [Amycolatopsis granulosa]|uniref:Lipoprotein-anchoring transpeptidase ErfK/SrfK n=2 Tax=Pseudonocardiaceae TaxID=2070 RepID=A0ABX0SRW5_9PSEU|nr:lipoprotein-anchoring transpeptidase ErfK/SrfK [Amycolatopsis viridis]NIH86724.1 lipoprotein-anchoring transpeptidase ErfK/SrfK [Amycolatopsis granulosa]
MTCSSRAQMESARRGRLPVRLLAVAGVSTLALLTGACSGGDNGDVKPAAVSQEDLTQLPEATTFATVANAPLDPQPTGGATSGKVVHPKADIVVYDGVGGKAIAKLPSIQMGSPTWVPVVSEQGEWAQVLLPTRPNAASGWIHLSNDATETAQNDYAINVNRAAFTLEILQGGKSIGKWTIGTGKPEHPTPAGRAYIIASIEETKNTYSPIVLPLSYHSDSLETFGGGPGTVGLHTWRDNSFSGQANSDGCIRVPSEALTELVKLPLGTIVNIT